jgi:hypothetical protein
MTNKKIIALSFVGFFLVVALLGIGPLVPHYLRSVKEIEEAGVKMRKIVAVPPSDESIFELELLLLRLDPHRDPKGIRGFLFSDKAKIQIESICPGLTSGWMDYYVKEAARAREGFELNSKRLLSLGEPMRKEIRAKKRVGFSEKPFFRAGECVAADSAGEFDSDAEFKKLSLYGIEKVGKESYWVKTFFSAKAQDESEKAGQAFYFDEQDRWVKVACTKSAEFASVQEKLQNILAVRDKLKRGLDSMSTVLKLCPSSK